MYKFLKPSKDTSIYKGAITSNTGLDPILEVGKFLSGSDNFNIARSLIQFDFSSLVSQSIETAHLILRVDQVDEIPLDYTIYAYPISGSWEMGTGRIDYDKNTYGVTWKYRDANSLTVWGSGVITGSSFSTFDDGLGGVWFVAPEASQSFNYQSGDTELNVIDAVTGWLSGSIPNNGLIIKHSNAADLDQTDYGKLQFFSKETHTIHSPRLRVGINDFTYSTGSLMNLNSAYQLAVVPKLKTNYKVNTKNRIEIVGRELYPTNIYNKAHQYKQRALPKISYYEIRDYLTDTIIIPFSDYSRISCNTTNINYIDLDFTDWEINRDYIINFKIERNGAIEYFNDNYKFRLIN
jgi:hypothetical protein